MPISRLAIICTLLIGLLTHCKKDDGVVTATSQTDLLIATNWRTTRVTTPDGTEINRSRLSLQTQVLYDLNMQFRNNGTVRALDPKQSNISVNAGTWVLAADNQSINVVVTGFSGNFPIIKLTNNKLILRQRAPVDGQDADVNLEFDPSL